VPSTGRAPLKSRSRRPCSGSALRQLWRASTFCPGHSTIGCLLRRMPPSRAALAAAPDHGPASETRRWRRDANPCCSAPAWRSKSISARFSRLGGDEARLGLLDALSASMYLAADPSIVCLLGSVDPGAAPTVPSITIVAVIDPTITSPSTTTCIVRRQSAAMWPCDARARAWCCCADDRRHHSRRISGRPAGICPYRTARSPAGPPRRIITRFAACVFGASRRQSERPAFGRQPAGGARRDALASSQCRLQAASEIGVCVAHDFASAGLGAERTIRSA